jgi:hypothetical protein
MRVNSLFKEIRVMFLVGSVRDPGPLPDGLQREVFYGYIRCINRTRANADTKTW